MNNKDDAKTQTQIDGRKKSRAYARMTAAALAVAMLSSYGLAEAPKPDAKPTPKKKNDLSRRLIDKAVKSGSTDLMGEITRLMNSSARQLEIDFDPGEATQAMQQQVLDQLDRAIKQAGRQRRPNPKNQKQSKSDKRKADDEKSQEKKGKASKKSDATQDDQPPRPGEAPSAGSDSKDGKLEESRRGWGALPQRKRDEVIQGASEAHLQQYREWIEQYYKALQESQE